MAKFLITHLQNGKYNGVEILNKSTTEFMHKQQLLAGYNFVSDREV
jgi:hypothetical protein